MYDQGHIKKARMMADVKPDTVGFDGWPGAPGIQAARMRHLDAGETLFLQGDPVVTLYRVRVGRIRLVRNLEDGAFVVLHVARPGETFAEASAFSATYHCDAVAEIPSEVASLPKAEFLAALQSDTAAGLAFARLLAAQVRDLRARAELRGIRAAPARIMAWLRMQASGNPPVVVTERTWSEIAAELGLTREAVYRGLAILERDGRIVRHDGKVVLGK
jgi:CRP/FNR family transcriptional regulator, dissimilatory nitrate respiration regulator